MKLGKISEQIKYRNHQADMKHSLETISHEARDQEEADRIYEEQLNEAKRISKLEQLKRVGTNHQASDEPSHSTELKNIRKDKKSQRSEREHLRALSNSLEMKDRLRKEQEEKVREEEEILELRRKLAAQGDSVTFQAQAQSTKNKKRFTERRSDSVKVDPSESPRRQHVEDSADDDEYLRSSKMRTARPRPSNTSPHIEQTTDEEEGHAPPHPRKSSRTNHEPKRSPEPPCDVDDLNAQFQGMWGIPLGDSPRWNRPNIPAPFPMYGFPFPPSIPPYGYGYGGYAPGTVINTGVGNITNSIISNSGNDNSVRKVYRKSCYLGTVAVS